MTSLASQILSIRQDIEALTDLSPGHGFDAIGERLTSLAAQPMNIDEAYAQIATAEAQSPGLLNFIQAASIRSEMELELFACAPDAGQPILVTTEHLLLNKNQLIRR